MSHHNGPPIIIKKKVESEEDHHGGVWKLAFADFMTAMMAFFLVMWLINSASKDTKAVIVQYFNPVQLVDATKAHKGLRDSRTGAEGQSSVEQPPQREKKESTGAKDTEAQLQTEPLKTLEWIAKEEVRTNDAPGFAPPRDPFDRAPRKGPWPRPGEEPSADDKGNSKQGQVSPTDKTDAASQLQAEIEKIAAQEIKAPRVEVKQTNEGLLISLTDDANFSMFDVGSIKPKPQLVRMIGDVGKILSSRPGNLEIRGHTDGRSYAGKNYDNWRLSSDRATLINYMLIRGGLPAARVERVVGFADRSLKNPKEPLAPVNRRIEILVRGAQP